MLCFVLSGSRFGGVYSDEYILAKNMSSVNKAGGEFTFVIDAGHGGVDGGAVGINGVLEKDILFAAHADKDRNGVFCDNWVLITEEEIVMIGGIQLVVPKEGVKKRDPKKLTVKYGKVSEYRMERAPLSDFKTEKQISGCILTAYNKETGSCVLVTYLTGQFEEDFQELCRLLNEKDRKEDAPEGEGHDHKAPPFGHGHRGGPHGGPRGPHGHGKGKNKDEDYCPKCGRRYPDPHNTMCPRCMDKASVIKRLFFFLGRY